MAPVVALELKSFRRARRPEPSALDEALEAELAGLGRQVRRRSDVEGAVRLRALKEIDAALSTDALCQLAYRLG